MNRTITLEGSGKALESLAAIKDSPKKAAMAINRTAAWTRTQSSKKMREEVNFKASYLNKNLKVGEKANQQSLSSTITARFRATSLARFAKGTPESTQKARKTVVTVSPSQPKTMNGAFLLKLKGLNGATSDGLANIGLAIRLKKGETLHNKKISVGKRTKGLAILYGPSVDQVFNTISGEIEGDIADYLVTEYERLLNL